jgi:membrane protein YqaA with SNARE-associated domain
MGELLDWLKAPLEALRDWTLQFATSPAATWWLFALSFAESSFFPVPPDVLLIAMGIGRPALSFWFALVCSVASVLGGCAGYGIGYWGGRPLVDRLFSRKKVEAVERMYAKYDVWAVAVAGFTPVPYKVFTITTGVLRAGFWRFVAASAASRSARFFMVAALTYFFGEQTERILNRHIGPATLALVAAALLGVLAIKVFSGKRRAGSAEAATEAETETGTGDGTSGEDPGGPG